MMDAFDSSAHIYIHKRGSLGYLLLNRPSKRNAMTMQMWHALPTLLKQLDSEPAVRVIIIASSDSAAFCSGADIATFKAVADDEEAREANRMAIREGQRALARCEKPTIAKISGPCIGAGCGIAIHCDMRLADSSSRLGITPAKLGLIYPLNDTKQLMDLVGVSNAKKMLFTARVMDAEEALEFGLIDYVFAPEDLGAECEKIAHTMAGLSQHALRGMKKSMRRVLDGQIDDDAETARWFTDAHDHADYSEGVAAFFEKRAAKFTWNGD